MSVKSVTPYLFFNGTAEQAIRFYERALGATTEGLMRYGEAPADTGTCPPEDKNRVMHAALRIGGAMVMLSDTPTNMPGTVGSNVSLCLELDDEQDQTRKFEALAATGKVTLALHDAFWGDRFGMLVDEHGVHWMFTCSKQK